MRPYTIDSPEAATRVLALALLADGSVSPAEIQRLREIGAAEQLGLPPEHLYGVVQGVCEDLLHASHMGWIGTGHLDERTLATLMAEIEDPALRLLLLRLAVHLVEADGHVSDGECLVLTTAVSTWGLQAAMLETAPAAPPG